MYSWRQGIFGCLSCLRISASRSKWRSGSSTGAWLAYPKKSAKVKPDINRDSLVTLFLQTYGWQGVAMVALDDTWAVMRFRPTEDVKERK